MADSSEDPKVSDVGPPQKLRPSTSQPSATSASAKGVAKRKRGPTADGPNKRLPGAKKVKKLEDARTAEKKKQKKKTRNKKPGHDEADLDLEAGINKAIGKMDARLLADHVAQRTKRFEADLSVVELEDKHIPEKAFQDTSAWQERRSDEHLPDFLEHFSAGKASKLASAPKAKGSPHTLVITDAGLRAANLTRALRKFQTKDATVAKLFAKHIKLKDAVDFVKETRMGIAVGTPARLSALLDAESLSLSKLERIVVDASHIDQKKRSIFDMREIFLPLVSLLNRPLLKERYTASDRHVDLLFF
ncbi:MAG: hypothetical protein M1832_006305 [Thelocarpon impressellum]|nr:MAG: hypothetical protein M1832_006305 [Thelocarpon impressellum]